MNKDNFLVISEKIKNEEHLINGVGTLKEKTLHSILKNYFEPNIDNHEIRVGRYVADIKNSSGIIEIQTRNFTTLRKKLDLFLKTEKVTIVYPIAKRKWISWCNMETYEVSKKRKSPKTGSVFDAFYELYKIKSYLTNKNLTLCIVLLDIEEYRFLNGYSSDKKRGSSRFESIPISLEDEVYLSSLSDYQRLIPKELADTFTVADYKKVAKISPRAASLALNVLKNINAVTKVSKNRNAIVYKRNI
ncbi:MAG: hypothetical protein RR306_01960 [Clostridia bacterium]